MRKLAITSGLLGLLLLNSCAVRLEDPFYRCLELIVEPSFNNIPMVVVEKEDNPIYVELGHEFRSESYLVCGNELSVHVEEGNYLQISVYAVRESLGFCSDNFDFIPFNLSDDEIAGLIGIRIIDPVEEYSIYTLKAKD